MSFGRDSIRTLVVRISTIFIRLIAGVINARCLGPEGIGIFILLVLVSEISFRFGNLGLGSAFSRFTAKKQIEIHEVLKLTLLVSGSMSIFLSVILLMVWRIEFLPWSNIPEYLFYFSMLGIPVLFIKNYLQRTLGGQLRIIHINVSELINCIAYVLLLILFVVFQKQGVLGAISAYISSQMFCLLYITIIFRRSTCLHTVSESVKHSAGKCSIANQLRRLFSYGLWNYFIMLTAFFFERLHVVLLKGFYSDAAVGIYAVANSLPRRLRILPTSFSGVLFPYTAASDDEEAIRRTNQVCRVFIVLMSLLGLFFFICGRWLIISIYGPKFQESVIVFYALLPSVLLFPLTRFITVYIAASGRSKLAFFIQVASVGIFFIPLSIILIPVYGPLGAAMAVSIGYLFWAIICVFVYIRLAGVRLLEILILQKSDFQYFNTLVKSVMRNMKTKIQNI